MLGIASELKAQISSVVEFIQILSWDLQPTTNERFFNSLFIHHRFQISEGITCGHVLVEIRTRLNSRPVLMGVTVF